MQKTVLKEFHFSALFLSDLCFQEIALQAKESTNFLVNSLRAKRLPQPRDEIERRTREGPLLQQRAWKIDIRYSSWSEGGSYPSDLPSGQPFRLACLDNPFYWVLGHLCSEATDQSARPSGQLVSGQVVSGQVVSGQVVGSNFGGFEAS